MALSVNMRGWDPSLLVTRYEQTTTSYNCSETFDGKIPPSSWYRFMQRVPH
uniref:Uncharacterized protein n=1 Tax=Oryza sativa subsp. japonica TaxID=39947 RepID=Q6Z266_ORYSJ|nr:hypothetical protein [Oryza sativa Japonica Group]